MRRLGLRRADMEGRCQVRHTQYLKASGWTYCPWCAQELIIKFHCDHCGNDFMSEAAFRIHNTQLSLHKLNKCPEGEDHQVKYLPRRDVFYCVACRLERPAKHPEMEAA
jgi:hypothetical protein